MPLKASAERVSSIYVASGYGLKVYVEPILVDPASDSMQIRIDPAVDQALLGKRPSEGKHDFVVEPDFDRGTPVALVDPLSEPEGVTREDVHATERVVGGDDRYAADARQMTEVRTTACPAS